MSKPNKDVWIRHRGGKCPVDAGTLVDVRHRNGEVFEGVEIGKSWKCSDWTHTDEPGDIMAWRPHKPSILDEPGEPNDSLKEVLELDSNESEWKAHDGRNCSAHDLSVVEVLLRNGAVLPAHDCERFTWEHSAVEADRQIMAYRVFDMREPVSYDDDYCDCDGPLQWRDRIREIDAASKEEEASHCAAMAAYDEERTSLVAKLKAEGFVLADEWSALKPSEIQVETGRVDDIAQQDMSDWRNWKEGDSVMMLEDYWTDFKAGSLYTISGIEKGGVRMNDDIENRYLTVDGETVFSDGRFPAFKWHSRPTK